MKNQAAKSLGAVTLGGLLGAAAAGGLRAHQHMDARLKKIEKLQRQRAKFNALLCQLDQAQRSGEDWETLIEELDNWAVARDDSLDTLLAECKKTDELYHEALEALTEISAEFLGTAKKTVKLSIDALELCEERLVAEKPGEEPEPEAKEPEAKEPEAAVVVLSPWRFRRHEDIPAPHLVDAQRLEKLPAGEIQQALHHAYDGNTKYAERLHYRIRLQAERAVAPLRESAVEALEDMYVLHPSADVGNHADA